MCAVWIEEEPCDVHAEIKQRTQLTCLGKGSGDLKYTWLKSSSRNGPFQFHKKTSGVGLLPFDPLSNLDAGYYQCQVENSLQHTDSKVVRVQALVPHSKEGEQS